MLVAVDNVLEQGTREKRGAPRGVRGPRWGESCTTKASPSAPWVWLASLSRNPEAPDLLDVRPRPSIQPKDVWLRECDAAVFMREPSC